MTTQDNRNSHFGWNLPDMDGHQILERLREIPLQHDSPIIAVSDNAMPRDIARGRAAGFKDYLTKTLDIQRLLEILDRHFPTPDTQIAEHDQGVRS